MTARQLATSCLLALSVIVAVPAYADPNPGTSSAFRGVPYPYLPPSAATQDVFGGVPYLYEPPVSGLPSSSSSVPSFVGLREQVDILKAKIASAQEQLSAAQAAVEQAQGLLVDAKVASTVAQLNADQAQVELESMAAAMYRGDGFTPLTGMNLVLSAKNAEDVLNSSAMVERVSASQSRAASTFLRAAAEVEATAVTAQQAADQAKVAQDQASAILGQLNADLDTATALMQAAVGAVAADSGPQTLVGPQGCPTQAPAGTLRDGSSSLGLYQLCADSVAQAPTPAAALAIKWALGKLGAPYACGGVGRMDAFRFDCSSLVSRAYWEGAGVPVAGQNWAPSTRNMVPWDGVGLDPWYSFVPPGQGRPGDLVLLRSCTGPDCAYQHVVMQLADGFQVHTSSCGDVAHVSAFTGPSDPTYLVTRRVMRNGSPGPAITLPEVPSKHSPAGAAHAPTSKPAGGEASATDPTAVDPNMAAVPAPSADTQSSGPAVSEVPATGVDPVPVPAP